MEYEKIALREGGTQGRRKTETDWQGTAGRDFLYGEGSAFYLYGKRRRVVFGQKEKVYHQGYVRTGIPEDTAGRRA